MNKKGFSLIEILFTLMITSIIITVAVTKFDTIFTKTDITKIKSDILLIRSGINLYKNSLILKNQIANFTTLDENDGLLFSKVLDKPISSSSKQWSQNSATTYTLFLDKETSIDFRFDSTEYTFDCDISNTHCADLSL